MGPVHPLEPRRVSHAVVFGQGDDLASRILHSDRPQFRDRLPRLETQQRHLGVIPPDQLGDTVAAAVRDDDLRRPLEALSSQRLKTCVDVVRTVDRRDDYRNLRTFSSLPLRHFTFLHSSLSGLSGQTDDRRASTEIAARARQKFRLLLQAIRHEFVFPPEPGKASPRPGRAHLGKALPVVSRVELSSKGLSEERKSVDITGLFYIQPGRRFLPCDLIGAIVVVSQGWIAR